MPCSRSSAWPRRADLAPWPGWSACAAVAWDRVCERVAREKSSKRSRSTTVRPTRPAARSRRVDAVDEADEDRVERRPATCGRAAERALGADRAAAAADPHRPGIAVVGQRVEVPARRPAEDRDQRRLGELGDLADGRDPAIVELVGGRPARRPTAARPAAGWRNASSPSGGTTSSPSGLATPLATLARNLVRATPTVIGRPTRSRTSRRSRAAISVGRAGDPPQPADVEERLVDREPFDQRRGVVEHLEHRLARLGVGRHPRLHHDRVRAQPAGLPRHPSPCGRRTPWPRSWRRARRPPPTITGRPRRRGSSRCSTEA